MSRFGLLSPDIFLGKFYSGVLFDSLGLLFFFDFGGKLTLSKLGSTDSGRGSGTAQSSEAVSSSGSSVIADGSISVGVG